jgi:hypothetical protein
MPDATGAKAGGGMYEAWAQIWEAVEERGYGKAEIRDMGLL